MICSDQTMALQFLDSAGFPCVPSLPSTPGVSIPSLLTRRSRGSEASQKEEFFEGKFSAKPTRQKAFSAWSVGTRSGNQSFLSGGIWRTPLQKRKQGKHWRFNETELTKDRMWHMLCCDKIGFCINTVSLFVGLCSSWGSMSDIVGLHMTPWQLLRVQYAVCIIFVFWAGQMIPSGVHVSVKSLGGTTRGCAHGSKGAFQYQKIATNWVHKICTGPLKIESSDPS